MKFSVSALVPLHHVGDDVDAVIFLPKTEDIHYNKDLVLQATTQQSGRISAR